MEGRSADAWWKTGVLYQIYPRSFADSNGDGIGDLRGITGRLDHLSGLGIDGIWLSPVTVSPNADWGYDVSDYCDISPEYGTLDDFDELVAEAGRRDIKVIMDLVPAHTSSEHAWFRDARSSRTARHRDWYVWADAKPDGSPPNNWLSSFGGSTWTFDEPTGQYYLHSHLVEQPDLNWWNDEVRDAFDGIVRFWFDRGVAGYRIDVCDMIVKDALLRDNPPATEDDPLFVRWMGQRSVYNSNQPEVHDVLRRWRAIADTYDPPRLLLGETNVPALDTLISFYGTANDELDLGFNFVFIESALAAEPLRAIVEDIERGLPDGAWPVWTGSNHDFSRFPTRWAGGDPAKARTALLMLLTLRGTPVLYQGDEIGQTDTTLTRDDLRDPVGLRFWPHYAGRDPERTPMPWEDGPGGGFTDPGVRSWLPPGDLAAANVQAQRDDPDSMLALCRRLITLRRSVDDLSGGSYTSLPCPPGAWAWRRGAGCVVAVNLSDTQVEVAGIEGAVAVGTDRSLDGRPCAGVLHLAPWQGAVATTASGH